MKKLIIALGFCMFFASCMKDKSLDLATGAISEDKVFSDSLQTIQFLNGIYSDGNRGIGFSFNKGRWETHGNQETSTDDAEYGFSSATRPSVMFYQGTFSAANYGSSPKATDIWQVPYRNIRRCNLLLKNLAKTPLAPSTKNRIEGEARCLRAWYYLQLLIVYGGVPNVGDNVYDIADQVNLPRQSFADLVAYLASELDAAGALLPVPNAPYPAGYQEIDKGRVTKGTAMGIKSRLLLYAASPLFNGGAIASATEQQKVLVSYPQYDIARWKTAADAAEAVINSNYYSLNVNNSKPGLGFYEVFLKRDNSEYILAYTRENNKDFESHYLPGSRSGANYSMPTQNLVDAFPMIDGKPITASSKYNPNNPYEGRDPRFNYSIIFNGARFASNSGGAQAFVWTFTGTGQTGDQWSEGRNTGYFSRKMLDSTITNNFGASTQRNWPLMRYAEILLNYAEAINEAGETAKAYPKLRELRARAGIFPGTDGNYGMDPAMNQEQMRNFVQNERRIELAFEDHRWNDIRRWKIAMTLYGGGPNGFNRTMRPIRNGSTGNLTTGVGLSFNYTIMNTIRQHVFRPEMYLLPIMDEEIRKMPAMIQNPGW